jgi:hypothetical protein
MLVGFLKTVLLTFLTRPIGQPHHSHLIAPPLWGCSMAIKSGGPGSHFVTLEIVAMRAHPSLPGPTWPQKT